MATAGTTLKGTRILRKLRQEDVAAKVGVSTDVIHRLEKDDPRVELATFVAVAQLLRVPIDPARRTAEPPADLDAATIELVAAGRRRGGSSEVDPFAELEALAARHGLTARDIVNHFARHMEHEPAPEGGRVVSRPLPPTAPAAGPANETRSSRPGRTSPASETAAPRRKS